MSCRALVLAIGVAAAMHPGHAAAAAPTTTGRTPPAERSKSTAGSPPPVRASTPPLSSGARRFQWSRCTPLPDGRCVRPRPARVLLLSLGALAGGVGAGILFALGDRLVPGDPTIIAAGTGAVASLGALLGMGAGRLRGDDPARADRVRPATGQLAYGLSPPTFVDERTSQAMTLRIAPTWGFADGGGRVRLLAHVGGILAPTKDVDPRPQLAANIDGQDGSAPVVQRTRQTSLGVGLDWAVRLPYPVLPPRRSAWLGPSEIRWKPDVQVRRDTLDVGRPTERVVARTMLLPLTVGIRWHVSPRQRFTMYAGPRFDFVSLSPPGSDTLARGRAQLGPLYAEAWYDLDVPFTAGPRRDGRTRRTQTNGQLTLGYTHSRFDGQGFNVGKIVGFFGPLHAQWRTRVRPVGSPVALQASAAVAFGNGLTMTASVGVVAPDVSSVAKRRGRKARR